MNLGETINGLKGEVSQRRRLPLFKDSPACDEISLKRSLSDKVGSDWGVQ